MTLYQFKIFLTIAKYGSVTRAAVELGLSQPALTHQMKLLQASYGKPLYIRTAIGIVLTPAGERLLVGIGPILELVGNLRFETPSAVMSESSGEMLRVGGIESASSWLLPTTLSRFRSRHPQVALEFRTRTSDQLERMVAAGLLDLAVMGRAPDSVELQLVPLRAERIALFVLPDNRLAHRKKLRLSDVVAEPLIASGGLGGRGVADGALKQLSELATDSRVGMFRDGPDAIKAAVAQRMGVGMVFEEALKVDVAAGRFKILEVPGLELSGESFIVYSKIRPLTPWAQEFMELLRAERDCLLSKKARLRGRGPETSRIESLQASVLV